MTDLSAPWTALFLCWFHPQACFGRLADRGPFTLDDEVTAKERFQWRMNVAQNLASNSLAVCPGR